MKKRTNSTHIGIQQKLIRAVTQKERARTIVFFRNNPALFSELLVICFDGTNSLSAKACRMLELVCMQDLSYVFPQLDIFLAKIDTLKKDAEKRPVARICEHLIEAYYQKTVHPAHRKLNDHHRQKITEVCFDWLITDQKVATKAHAMTCLLQLGTEFEWIHPELETILKQDYALGSAAYKARARKVLKKIDR